MIAKLTRTKGIALLLSALIVGMMAGPAAAALIGEKTVEVTDPDSQEIEATVELVDDPAAANTTVELVNASDGSTVETVQLEGSTGSNVTQTMAVNTTGNYTVTVTADHADNATLQSIEVVDSSSGGLFGATTEKQQWMYLGGLVLIVGAAGAAYREMDDNNGF